MCSVRRGAASTARSSPMSGCSIRSYGSVGVDGHGQGLGGIAGGASDRGDVSGSVETLKITSALLRDWDCAHTTPGCGQQKGMFHRAYLAIFASSGVPQVEAERCWLASRFCRPTTAGISGPGLGTSELALPWAMPGVATFRVSDSPAGSSKPQHHRHDGSSTIEDVERYVAARLLSRTLPPDE